MLKGEVDYRHADKTYPFAKGIAFLRRDRPAWTGESRQTARGISLDHHLPERVTTAVEGRYSAPDRRTRHLSHIEKILPLRQNLMAPLPGWYTFSRAAPSGIRDMKCREPAMTDVSFQSAVDLAGDIRAKKIGSLEALEHLWRRGERYNPPLNAVIFADMDRARARARKADAALARGEIWGPLHGVPMTIKESYDVAGMPTTWGVLAFKDNIPTTNAVDGGSPPFRRR